MAIRILIADDHELVRAGLSGILAKQADMEVVGEAGDGETAVRLAGELSPDVIMLDVTMPRLNGIDAARAILAVNPEARIICVSLHLAQKVVTEVFAAGVAAYLPKNSSPAELIFAVRAVHAGEQYVGTRVARTVVSTCMTSSAAPESCAFRTLGTKEREVLQLLAEGKSNKEIASLLHISARTVEAHRAQLMEKLGIRTLAGLTRYAIREGLTPLDT